MYIDLDYEPKEDIVAKFRLEACDKKIAKQVAMESSTGTWTSIKKPKEVENIDARVFDINKPFVKIAYPIDLFEKGNISQLLSSVAGNIFGMKALKNLRLEDISFPKKYLRDFKGPKYGIDGVRNFLKIKKRPLLGTIVKPKVGLSSKQFSEVAYKAWKGGVDIVKDDENLTSLKGNRFEDRIVKTLEMRDKAINNSGQEKAYMPNITGDMDTMMKRAELVKEHGGRYAMIDIIACGWSALQSFRQKDMDLAIHAHRAGHAAFTRNEKHGISMLVIAKLARLIGVDQLHIGAIVGKMEGTKDDVLSIEDEIESNVVIEEGMLEEDWYDIQSVLAVASGGLYPGKVPALVDMMGNNIVIQAGGGIHGHPDGTVAGAKAMKQALEATLDDIGLEEYAKDHEELGKALKKWG